MFKNVLLSVDGSIYATHILDYGKYFARYFDSFLRLLHVVDVRMYEWSSAMGMDGFATVLPSATFQEESQKFLEDRAKDILDQGEKCLQEAAVKYEILKEYGSPAEVILEKSKVADLTILGIKGEYAKWSNKFLGMVTETVSRTAYKPLLLVQDEFRPFSRVLLAYDGSAHAAKALSAVAFLAERLNLHVVVVTSHTNEVIATEIMNEAVSYLYPYEISYEEVLRNGHADADILDVCQEKECDLIAMGAYGHSRIREAIIGSITIQVLRKSDVPLLLMR